MIENANIHTINVPKTFVFSVSSCQEQVHAGGVYDQVVLEI